MTENDRLILNFIGEEHEFLQELRKVFVKKKDFEGIVDFKRWAWIMPVVEKIETTSYRLGDRVGAASKRLGLTEDSEDTVDIYLTYDNREEYRGWSWTLSFLYAKDIATCTERKDKKLEAIYEAVVTFIKWYNKTKR